MKKDKIKNLKLGGYCSNKINYRLVKPSVSPLQSRINELEKNGAYKLEGSDLALELKVLKWIQPYVKR